MFTKQKGNDFYADAKYLAELLEEAENEDQDVDIFYEIEYSYSLRLEKLVLTLCETYDLFDDDADDDEPLISHDLRRNSGTIFLHAVGVEGLLNIIRFNKEMTTAILLDALAKSNLERLERPLVYFFKRLLRLEDYDNPISVADVLHDVEQGYLEAGIDLEEYDS